MESGVFAILAEKHMSTADVVICNAHVTKGDKR